MPSQVISFGLGSPTGIGWGITFGLGDTSEYAVYRDLQRSIDPADWDGDVTAYLEVHGATDDSGFPLSARLYNVTDSGFVAGSAISASNTTPERKRSGPFPLASGTKVYEVRYGGPPGATYTLTDAALIVDVAP